MKIILAGAGAFALEVEQYILDCRAAGRGIFDYDNTPIADAELVGLHFREHARLGDFQTRPLAALDPGAEPPSKVRVLIAIGNAELRRKVWGELRERGVRFVKLLHPTSVVAPNASLGEGSIVCPFAFVSNLATIGNNVALNTYASVGHDSVVGDHTVISPYACLNGGVTLGAACFLGSGCLITEQNKIGSFSKVSAGAVVFEGAPSGSLLTGNPAKGRQLFRVSDV
jgi:sugar O-acyltransferase (sialic acid O-acetyltransferase NeuD family)